MEVMEAPDSSLPFWHHAQLDRSKAFASSALVEVSRRTLQNSDCQRSMIILEITYIHKYYRNEPTRARKKAGELLATVPIWAIALAITVHECNRDLSPTIISCQLSQGVSV
jgi:hypothetical protein